MTLLTIENPAKNKQKPITTETVEELACVPKALKYAARSSIPQKYRESSIGICKSSGAQEELMMGTAMRNSLESFLHSWHRHYDKTMLQSSYRVKAKINFCHSNKCPEPTYPHATL